MGSAVETGAIATAVPIGFSRPGEDFGKLLAPLLLDIERVGVREEFLEKLGSLLRPRESCETIGFGNGKVVFQSFDMIKDLSSEVGRGLDEVVEKDVDHDGDEKGDAGKQPGETEEGKHAPEPTQHEGDGEERLPHRRNLAPTAKLADRRGDESTGSHGPDRDPERHESSACLVPAVEDEEKDREERKQETRHPVAGIGQEVGFFQLLGQRFLEGSARRREGPVIALFQADRSSRPQQLGKQFLLIGGQGFVRILVRFSQGDDLVIFLDLEHPFDPESHDCRAKGTVVETHFL